MAQLALADLGDGQVILDASAWDEAGCRPAGGSEEDTSLAEEDEAPSDGAATAAQPAPSLGLDADAVVYAFKESPIRALSAPLQQVLLSTAAPSDAEADGQDLDVGDAGGDDEGGVDLSLCKVPNFYMGEYKVVGDPNANPAALTLAPTMPLSDAQIQQLQDANSTWVLYEVMPVDAHKVFEGFSAEQLRLLISQDSMDDEQYQALIESYARDLQPGNDMDPPERKWMTVEFTQPMTIDVDVDVAADEGQQPLPDSLFDPSGRSVVATLSQGGTTEFQAGDQATFDFATAMDLINNQGKAKSVETIFHRRLRDYARAFRSLVADVEELSRQSDLAQADLEKLNESIAQLQAQTTFQTQQREALAGDLKGLNTERQVLGEYSGLVEKKWNELRGFEPSVPHESPAGQPLDVTLANQGRAPRTSVENAVLPFRRLRWNADRRLTGLRSGKYANGGSFDEVVSSDCTF